MTRLFIVIALAAVAGCSSIPGYQAGVSPCSVEEASYACQVERYHNVP